MKKFFKKVLAVCLSLSIFACSGGGGSTATITETATGEKDIISPEQIPLKYRIKGNMQASEYNLITDGKSDYYPDEDSKDYIVITENKIKVEVPDEYNNFDPTLTENLLSNTQGPRPVGMNNTHVPKGTDEIFLRKVTIAGKKIVIEEGHENGIYENYNNHKDIQELSFHADVVIVKDNFHLPQTNLSIYTRELKFEGDDAKIDLTPESVPDGVNLGAAFNVTSDDNELDQEVISQAAKDGYSGLDSGNLNLNIVNVSTSREPGEDYRPFVLVGGKGQKPGAGREGRQAAMEIRDSYVLKCSGSATISSYTYLFFGQPNSYLTIDDFPFNIKQEYQSTSRWCYNAATKDTSIETDVLGQSGTYYMVLRSDKFGSSQASALPRDGADALSSGLPGIGGKGGIVTSTIALNNNLFNLIGGENGDLTMSPNPDDDMVYRGGRPDEPSIAYHFSTTEETIYTWGLGDTIRKVSLLYGKELKKHAQVGASADVLEQTGVAENGIVNLEQKSYKWISPFAMQMMIAHAKDIYLNNNFSAAQSLLQDYYTELTAYKESDEWSELPIDWQTDLDQQYQEINTMLHTLASDRDYFGNPGGWAPMISFEVSKAMFNNEIDRAFEVLYLSYLAKDTYESFENRKETLWDQLDKISESLKESSEAISSLTEKMPVLEQQAGILTSKANWMIEKVQIKENELLLEAETNIRLKNKESFLKTASRVLGTVAQVCPVGQPLMGGVGTALSTFSNIDENTPWETIQGFGEAAYGIGSGYSDFGKQLDEEIKILYASLDKVVNKTEFSDISIIESVGISNAPEIVTSVEEWRSQIGLPAFEKHAEYIKKATKGLKSPFRETSVPDSEVQEEFAKLKAECAEYQELIKKSEELYAEKQKFTEDITTSFQALSRAFSDYSRDIVTIDAIRNTMSDTNAHFHPRTTLAMDDMERRAKERLLKYHYYMAKAYEYRLLKKYDSNMSVNHLFEQLLDMLDYDITYIEGQNRLTHDDFMALKAQYRIRISNIIENIYNEFLSNRPERSRPVRFNLSDQQIADLNSGEAVTLNLDRIGLFRSNEENCRIVDLKVVEMDADVIGDFGMFGDMVVEFKHSGKSVFKKDGYKYFFQNYNNDTDNPIVWKTIYDPYDQQMYTDSISAASESLLSSLFDGNGKDMMLFSRPSAWADLTISKSVHAQLYSDVNIKSMRVELVYDYTEKAEFRELEVQMHDNRLMPAITVSAEDVTGRADGAGCITRTYRKDVKSVVVTVPETYGDWTFVKWTDSKGQELDSLIIDNPESPTVTVNLTDDISIKAQYYTTNPDILNDDGTTLPDAYFYN